MPGPDGPKGEPGEPGDPVRKPFISTLNFLKKSSEITTLKLFASLTLNGLLCCFEKKLNYFVQYMLTSNIFCI